MKIRLVIALALIPQIFIIKYLKNNPSIIDEYYVSFVYNFILELNSSIFSKINFPIGEILYLAIIVLFIYLVFRIFSLKRNDFLNLFTFISIIYFFFYSFWGLNYFRTSISSKLNIKSDYEYSELNNTLEIIINEINNEIRLIDENINISDVLHLGKSINYNIKKSIIPDFFLYQRVSGHYIPFTSEAIFIESIPLVDIPVVIFHEQAHQKGFADEGDASFIAFTKAIQSEIPYIRYSGYFNALMNLLNEVVKNHPEKLEDYIDLLDKKVISEINFVQNFWSKYADNFFDKVQNYIYDLYLKSNNQEAGIMSYSEVSVYIIDYYQRDILSNFLSGISRDL